MTSRCGVCARLTGLLALLALASRADAQTGDSLCDARQSTADTCVIAADQTLPDGGVLTFTKPNVRVRSNLTFGRCAPDPATACASDADCAPPARCLRTAETIQVAGRLSVDAGGKITARGKAAAGDTIGPDGGAITLSAHDVSLADTVSVSADGTTGVPAGHAGRIVIDADGTVTLAASAFLDASTSSGGCGGTIGIGNGAQTPATLTVDGQVSVDGATLGGTIELVARDQLTLMGTLGASNTNSDRSRPACAEGVGGGTVRLGAASVDFDGSARARGNQAAGGVVRLEGARGVTLDFPRSGAAISVTGGDANAVTPGGSVFLSASAGDVIVRQGDIEADGISTGFGSDAGVFSLTATGTMQCLAGGTPCASGTECAPGDACVESGGQVLVQAPLFAAGGAGLGSGCVACEVRGTGAVTVSAAIDVSGGRQGGLGGKVSITGGGDLTVGPGPITADAFDGGDIVLKAGERIGAARDVGGALRIVNGTQVRAAALRDDRFGGNLQLEGCDVTLEPSAALIVDGGSHGHAGQLSIVAHERLAVESLATLSALPDGASALTYRVDESVAPDAVLQPRFTLVTDATLSPCPPCGNGFVDPGEECDEGAGNRDAANHCRLDCTLPRCGDATRDFPHCAGDPDTPCTTADDCPAGAACEPGEACDLGTATCIGGSNGGAPCCAEADCPGGDCPGDGCTANRNDIAGCCRCDCTLSTSSTSTTSPTVTTTTSTSTSTTSPTVTTTTSTSTSTTSPTVTITTSTSTSTTSPTVATTTSTSSSTSSTGATSSTSTTLPPECTPGTPGACDDGDRCTVDSCAGAGGCRHDPLGYDAIAASLAPSLDLQACSGQRIPAAIGRLMKQARKLVERAAHARRPKRAEDLVRRALGKLSTAVRTVQRAGRHRLSPDCAGALAAIVGDARAETACLLRPALASPALTAPTGRE